MRRAGIGWIAALALLGAPGAARADQEIVADTPNRYTTPSVTIDQGEPLYFRNRDFARHDVTHLADQPLFRSAIIGQNETAFVEGSQHLTTGTYEFFCSIHPQMKGTLNVTAAGQPAPPPGSGGDGGGDGPDTVEPAVALEFKRFKARKVRRTRTVKLLVGADEASRLLVRVYVGGRRAGKLRLGLSAPGTRRVEVRISKKARKRVRRGRKLTFLVKATDAAGNTGSDRRSAKLR